MKGSSDVRGIGKRGDTLATAVAVAPDMVDVRNVNGAATAASVQAGPSERAQLWVREVLTELESPTWRAPT
jgi:hypothetical protein